ncbi:MAG: hypothetical protein H7061_11535, partial [Bdellovibrionaceae bacterium]|nr:hypothetical protein [Bdellovibrio sp.]
MKNQVTAIKSTSLAALLILSLGCTKKTEAVADAGAGGAALFTAADIQKTWTSGCLIGSDPITGADHYIQTLTLFGGGANSFNASKAWYLTSCTGANTKINYSLSGSYSVGAAITGGQAITFN